MADLDPTTTPSPHSNRHCYLNLRLHPASARQGSRGPAGTAADPGGGLLHSPAALLLLLLLGDRKRHRTTSVPLPAACSPDARGPPGVFPPAEPSTPTGSKTPKQEAEDGCSGVEEEEEEEGRRQTLANGTPALQPEVESPGVNNSFCSHVDVKGRTGATTLRENVCQICERAGELVLCEGQCYGAFHPQCLGLAVAPKRKFLCRECRTGAHACFVCKKAGGGVKRCLIPMCGKFYHSECVL
ncbi:hypothetical protein CRUP_002461, partial [Coryphaenoides rupestris]